MNLILNYWINIQLFDLPIIKPTSNLKWLNVDYLVYFQHITVKD